MDYDATDIASAYDRGRDHGPAFLDLWMKVVSSHVNGQRIETVLDLAPSKLGRGGKDVTTTPWKPFTGTLWVTNPTR